MVFSGVIAATAFTLFVVPAAYSVLARRTGSPGDVRRRLDERFSFGFGFGLAVKPVPPLRPFFRATQLALGHEQRLYYLFNH